MQIRLRPLFVALVALVALAAQAQSGGVAFQSNGGSAATVLPLLGKALGAQLRAGPDMANVLLILRFKGMPKAEALRRIADVTLGSWRVGSDGAQELVPDDARIASLRAAALAARLALVKASLAEIVQDAASGNGKNGDPATAAVAQLTPAIDPAGLAALGPDERLVYSTRPSPLQRPLPASAEALLAKLAADGRVDRNLPIDSSPFDKGDLVFVRGVDGVPGLMCHVRLFDRDGGVMYQADVAAPLAEHQPAASALAALPEARDDDAVKVQPLTLECLNDDRDGAAPSDELRAALRDPSAHDPIAYFGEVLNAYAADRGFEVVASPYDVAPRTVAPSLAEIRMGSLDAALRGLPISQDGSCLVFRRAVVDPRPVYDRPAATKLLQATDDSGAPSVDQLVDATQAGMLAMADFAPVRMLLAKMLVVAAPQASVLSYLAALPRAQAQALVAGDTVGLGEAGPAVQAMVKAGILSDATKYTVAPIGAETSFGFPVKTDYLIEPTEAVSSYAPKAASLKLIASDEPIYEPKVALIDDPAPLYTAPEFATWLKTNSTDAAKLGVRLHWELRVSIATGVYWSETLDLDQLAADATFTPLQELTGDAKDRLDAAIKTRP